MIGIETIVEAEGWPGEIGDAAALADRVFDAVRRIEPKAAGAAALLLADDAALRDLNSRFRGKDAATNVLAFPSGDRAPGFIGDMAVAFETCVREAQEKGVAVADHAAHLIAHGLLHLAGHDHLEAHEAKYMESLEIAALDALGVSNPYETEET